MKMNKVINRKQLVNDGATGANVELYQRSNGRCRLFWYSFDQDGSDFGTIATFYCKDWKAAIERGTRLLSKYILDIKSA